MKKTAMLFCTVFLLLCFAGCGPNGSKLTPKRPVTLVMWHVYGSQTESPLNQLVDEFNHTVGTEKGITINVESVTSSSAIDRALASSANGEPGAAKMPDLFTAYPRVVELVGQDRLLDWSQCLSAKELAAFRQDYLSEGYFGDRLLMLPIAKSTEAFYLNKTLFDRFCAETGASAEQLGTFEGVFETACLYYDWSGGRHFMQINDFYHYAYVGLKAYDTEFVRNGRLRLDDEAFETIWQPLAKAAIYGGVCLEDGYAAARWKTAEIIANTGSTADVLYQPSEVIYSDNSTEAIEAVALPYPTFTADAAGVIYRGGGLFALQNEDERKNEAAAVFARWLTEKQHNLEFVTSAGYLPVTDEAFEALFRDFTLVDNPDYRSVYRAVAAMQSDYTFYAVPLYDGAAQIQPAFEKNVKAVLSAAHHQYLTGVEAGEDPDAVLDELVATSLAELKRLSAG